ncbi:RNA polymerase sigma factor [Metallibacterium scheffleri]
MMDGTLPGLRPAMSLPSSDDADATLVAAATRGSVAAFETLYRRHAPRVFGVLLRLAGYDRARAEDLTQDAFLQAWRALSGFHGDSAFGTWLYRIAVNGALASVRAAGHRITTSSADDGVDDAAADAGFCPVERSELQRAVASLPPRARSVLVLHDIEGWTHAEIARALDLAPGSCKAHLHRARALLRAQLHLEDRA